MAEQTNWRYCQNCHAMFFNGYQGGRCPAGDGKGSHSAQGLFFALPYDVPATDTDTAQANWRFCLQCNVLFFDGYARGRCAVGGGRHTPQGINFVLPHDVAATPTAQANWRFCQNCNAMFYDGYPDKGKCPAGGADGGHSPQGFNFNLPIQQETAPVSPAIAKPRAPAIGTLIDVVYHDASGNDGVFWLAVDCSSYRWKLYDARLNISGEIGGRHGPPGIDSQSGGAITGTAFWRDGHQDICFELYNFVSLLWSPGKYSAGRGDAGKFDNPPAQYHLSTNALSWSISL